MAILGLLREKKNLVELVMAKVAAPKAEQAIFIGCEIVDYPAKNLQVMVVSYNYAKTELLKKNSCAALVNNL